MNFPIGTIILWASEIIPAGWQVCDGSNGTPNLIDRFIKGCTNDDELLDTGGANSHSHTFSSNYTGYDGAHTHDIDGFNIDNSTAYFQGAAGAGVNVTIRHPHSISSTTTPSGGNHCHTVGAINNANNLPPYIKLVYIMRMA